MIAEEAQGEDTLREFKWLGKESLFPSSQAR